MEAEGSLQCLPEPAIYNEQLIISNELLQLGLWSIVCMFLTYLLILH